MEGQLPTNSNRHDYPPWTGRSSVNGHRFPHASLTDIMRAGHSMPRQYAKRFSMNNSDAQDGSSWTSKVLLAMDGGGIRGYSSLLIIKKLLNYIAFLEKGGILTNSQGHSHQFFPCSSSTDYPWSKPPGNSRSLDNNVVVNSSIQPSIIDPIEPNRDAGAGASRHSSSHDLGINNATGTIDRDDANSELANASSNSLREAGNLPGNELQIPDHNVGADMTHSNTGSPSRSSNTLEPSNNGDANGGVQERDTDFPEDSAEGANEDTEQDLKPFLIHHYFDYVAGTSTGGLSALMLARMKMDIDDAMQQYHTIGNKVFARPRLITFDGLARPKYKSEDMKQALHAVLEHGLRDETLRTGITTSNIALKNGNDLACHTAVVAWGGGDVKSPYIFRSYDHEDLANSKEPSRMYTFGRASDAKIWKVARATSAAPKYFSKQIIDKAPYLDGGMGTNNPALHIFDDIEMKHDGRYPELVVTVGTGLKGSAGESPAPARHAVKKSGFKPVRHLVGMFKTATSELPDIVTDSEKDHERLRNKVIGYRRMRQKGVSQIITDPQYFRFNAEDLGSMVKLDEWKPSRDADQPNGNATLETLTRVTDKYLQEGDVLRDLKDAAIKLVAMRRRRAETERWEQFATQYSYKCLKDDRCGAAQFASREALRRHALESHEVIEWVASSDTGDVVCMENACSKRDQVGLDEHLKKSHHLRNPTPMSQKDFEAWLDKRRVDPNDSLKMKPLAKRDSPKDMKEERRRIPIPRFTSLRSNEEEAGR